jgi:exonuclease V gamma subunit
VAQWIGHPLLAAWGRQGRDFIRQLDAYDDAEATRKDFVLPRIDIFDDAPEDGETPLLNRVQNRIRDLEPLRDESGEVTISPDDRSITFQIAHSKVREMEVLQDYLLQLLGADKKPGEPLHPRDVVVMVPDIEVMAPAIRAVFGQYQRKDKRYIPFDIADLSARSSSPIVAAMEWLLHLPSQRCRMSDLLDLLEVPALAKRFGLEAQQLTRLTHWMAGAGIRWGLNLEHRQALGLASCGEQNSAWFGLRRMLLGYVFCRAILCAGRANPSSLRDWHLSPPESRPSVANATKPFQDVHSGYPLKGEGGESSFLPVTSVLLVHRGQCINLRRPGWSSLTGHKWSTLSGHRGSDGGAGQRWPNERSARGTRLCSRPAPGTAPR